METMSVAHTMTFNEKLEIKEKTTHTAVNKSRQSNMLCSERDVSDYPEDDKRTSVRITRGSTAESTSRRYSKKV